MKKKLCPKCKKKKSLNEFYVCPSRPGGYRGNCKKCEIKSVIQWHKTPTGNRSYINSKLKKRYGITIDDYDQMVEDQNGICAICGKLNKHGRRLCVDHDHKTGRVRGLLCDRCNLLLATFDDIELFKKITKYLKS